ncbi:MAG: 16S rRNA (cytosine(967)-C(5))-methyltransferase RsmB [Azoarcus sp.]|jgi:16S rRNA (cytosine967-C5)-methyltransferase|nr:16S rRNA (cytosine(967)-C(5))-methyltransferase RsmB [Azoarcus sp.]
MFHVKHPPKHTAAKPALKHDSLAYALLHAAKLVEVVREGKNLTAHYELLQQENPAWPNNVRGAIRDLAWNALRHYGRGDLTLSHFLSKPLPNPVHALLLVAVDRLERCPEQSHTLVDQAVIAVATFAPGLKGVVNAVLRNILRKQDELSRLRAENPVACHAYPAWWIERIRRQYENDWENILAAGNRYPPMSLRVNRRQNSIETYLAELESAGISARRLANDALLLKHPLPVSKLPGFSAGRVSVQDAGAQWAARWLAPRNGERVLDACAAPGGKSAHLLELADIHLTALELDPARSTQIRATMNRLGLQANITTADCRVLDSWWDKQPYDRILADVPCSASGVVRRHPDIKWLRRESDIAGFVAQQATILQALWRTLVPGGILLYATCSVFNEENQLQIERFLAGHPDAELSVQENGEQPPHPLLPNNDHDGFYYARLRKKTGHG